LCARPFSFFVFPPSLSLLKRDQDIVGGIIPSGPLHPVPPSDPPTSFAPRFYFTGLDTSTHGVQVAANSSPEVFLDSTSPVLKSSPVSSSIPTSHLPTLGRPSLHRLVPRQAPLPPPRFFIPLILSSRIKVQRNEKVWILLIFPFAVTGLIIL